MEQKTILVTGAAGFIGFHLCKELLNKGYKVIGVDNFNKYYSLEFKFRRIDILNEMENFYLHKVDITNFEMLCNIAEMYQIDLICNLAAQAGVRHSLEHPFDYQKSNLEGFLSVLEVARKFKVENLVYASSSSVYGMNEDPVFSVHDRTDRPKSLYAATKKANELMAYSYSHLYGIHCTGLRYFTVYGPWGRPDMALFLFTDAIMHDKPIKVFNYGRMRRDFTYIDDIVAGTILAIENPRPYDIFNLGNTNPVELKYFISLIEAQLGKTAEMEMLPMQPGDVESTEACIAHSKAMLGWEPKVSLEEGIKNFIDWYKEYYNM